MSFLETDNLRIDAADGVAVLALDVRGRGVNVLTRPLLADLATALDRLEADTGIHTLLIRSARPTGFLAGADLHEFARIRTADEAIALSETGQRLFDRLERLRAVTVAVVAGPCLGGGLELALACDYRFAVEHPRTQFGFPEIELGLLPGWGGTQRLPRVVGLEPALKIILGGRRLDARQARRWGLVEAVLPQPAREPADPGDWVRALPPLPNAKQTRSGLPLRTWRQRLLESNPLGRRLLFGGTERLLDRKIPDDMPAPREALQAVRTGITCGPEAGFAREREGAGRMAVTPACHNLIGLFLQREQARKLPSGLSANVRRVGVVGAGTMGAGIAQLALLRGAEVVVQEVNEGALGAGVLKIAALLQKAAERGLLSKQEAERRLGAVRGTTKWEGFGDVDVVVEAAVEEPSAKCAVFRELDQRTSPAAILATNTSSLSVASLQQGLTHPERVAGLHFFNPVHKMPLVEVVTTPATDEHVADVLSAWAVALGKTPVRVKDSPGFLVNRILMPYLNEAVRLVAEGLSIEQVDDVMRRFGMPMGPLELLDQVGLDVAAHIAQALAPAFGQRFPANPAFERLSGRGWLGQKSGTGFYRHKGKKRTVNAPAADLVRAAGPADATALITALPPAVQLREARDRMVLLMVSEAAACLGEGLAGDAAAIDLAMVLGTGWAPHRGGPLRYADDRGVKDVARVLDDLARRVGPRFEPCIELRRRAEQGVAFHPTPAVLV